MSDRDRDANSPLRAMTSHNNLHAVLFNATSAEYYALTTQIYQLARHVILERLHGGTFRNPAVVMDLDETVLDNSPYQAWLIHAGANFHEGTSWRAWCDLGEASAVPGAVEFIHFAKRQGVEVLFITSRQNSTRMGTARNLEALGVLTQEEVESERRSGTREHSLRTRLFMKGMDSVTVNRLGLVIEYPLASKFQHRRFCEELRSYEIALSIGDNLADWGEYYGSVYDESGAKSIAHPTAESRRQAAYQDKQLFGRDFILLPNASYGGWLRAFEAQGEGASDELAGTASPVRGELTEPQDEFRFDGGQAVRANGPKLSPRNLRLWSGPEEVDTHE